MSHDKPSMSWRRRKASSVWLSQFKFKGFKLGKLMTWLSVWGQGLKNMMVHWCKGRRTLSSDVRGQDKKDVSVSEERLNLPFLCLFVLFVPTAVWMTSTHIARGQIFSTQSMDSNTNLFQKCPGIPRNNTSPAQGIP